MKILIIDDSPIMRKIVKKSLSETKFSTAETVEAGDGQEALKIYKNGGIDWIFCDWNMPNMNGLEFVIQARQVKTPKHVPIIMVTTEGTMGKVEEALNQGADRYIVKPFTALDLEKNMNLVLNKMAA